MIMMMIMMMINVIIVINNNNSIIIYKKKSDSVCVRVYIKFHLPRLSLCNQHELLFRRRRSEETRVVLEVLDVPARP